MPDGDKLSIATPELVALGLGSRRLALFVAYVL